MTTATRIERDHQGVVHVPADALWGAQTERARHHLAISGQALPSPFVDALLHLKAAAAEANQTLGVISEDMGDAIGAACGDLLAMPDRLRHFPLDRFQSGPETGANTNANEVIALLASRRLRAPVRAHEHVNAGQSGDDIVPSAIHVAAALLIAQALLPALQRCRERVLKQGPAFAGWAEQLQGNVQRLQSLQAQLQALAHGGRVSDGTAPVAQAHPDFAALFHTALSERCGLVFAPAAHYFTAMGAQDATTALSGQLKTLAITLTKMAHDLPGMNPGMLVPETAAMVAAEVIGNDAAITIAGQAGHFERHGMLPLVAHRLIESLQLVVHVLPLLSQGVGNRTSAGAALSGDFGSVSPHGRDTSLPPGGARPH